MIELDEAHLFDLLTKVAETFDVPADGPHRVLAAAEAGDEVATPLAQERPQPLWRRPRVLTLAAASVVVLVVATVTLGSFSHPGTRRTETAGVGASVSTAPPAAPIPRGDQGQVGATGAGTASNGTADSAISRGVAPPLASATPQGSPAPAPASVTPLGETAKVVKTGSVDIAVARADVSSSMTKLTSIASGVNGYVAKSTTTEGGDAPSGTMTLRVPTASFEGVVAQVRVLGRVRTFTSQGQDVTAQYTDLQARITALTASRDQLLGILSRATNIGDVLSVQDRITQVQTQIDELQGQKHVLDDETTYASLDVSISEDGGHPAAPEPRTGLAKAWDDAANHFSRGVDDVVAASGALLLVLVILALVGALAWGAWNLWRRRLL